MAIQGPIQGKVHVEANNSVYGIVYATNSKILRRIGIWMFIINQGLANQ